MLRIFRADGITRIETLDAPRGDVIEGTMSSGGLMALRVAFRFVRGRRQISAREVEGFTREAQLSGSNKGLLITSGVFTQEAQREAARSQSPRIDLIDASS